MNGTLAYTEAVEPHHCIWKLPSYDAAGNVSYSPFATFKVQ